MSYRELSDKEVTTRKAHACAWCGERIAAGERVQARSYHFDGALQSDHMHPECYQAMQNYPDPSELGDGWTKGEFLRGSFEPA